LGPWCAMPSEAPKSKKLTAFPFSRLRVNAVHQL
jgi:hypothetical protein